MAAIPRVDINIVLRDAGYKFSHTEADNSTTLGTLGIGGSAAFAVSLTIARGGSGINAARFPVYNSVNGAMSPAYSNNQLGASVNTPFAFDDSGPSPVNEQSVWDGSNFWVFDFGNFNPGGVLQVKQLAWPGVLNQSSVGLNALNISNPGAHSLYAVCPVIFSDASRGFIVSANNVTTGFDELLPVTLAQAAGSGTPTTWVLDQTVTTPNLSTQTFSYPFTLSTGVGINLQSTLVNTPTVEIYSQVYNITSGVLVQTIALRGSGDLPALVAAVFKSPDFPDLPFYYANRLGLFAIDFDALGTSSGNWYVAPDCSAYGKVTFTMPDASIGPSGAQTVYWVNRMNNGGFGPGAGAEVYPNFDTLGNAWWLRVPLVDGAFNMVIEALTGEVYTSAAPPPKLKRFIDPNTLPRVPLPFCMKFC